MASTITPGLIAIHGNQLEQLGAAIFSWLRQQPLDVLEQETFIVQSNGVAEWLKISLAAENGICAATRVMLPARFLWESYRSVLGPQAVARRSPFDKSSLTWRLMHMLPQLLAQEVFAPLRHFLADGAPERRLQLAQKLADLFDGYQVFRSDWLADWDAGRDELRCAAGPALPLPPDQAWQAALWRAVMLSVDEQQRYGGRAHVHQHFLQALMPDAASDLQPDAKPDAKRALPRRIVVFGLSALPRQTLEALGALAQHTQVVIAVANPCQFYWGDIIQGRELLRANRHRQDLREGRDLSQIPPEELHSHSHPLLAAWGRMGRDFIRMLDEFDDANATRATYQNLRLDLFSEGPGQHLLAQVQAAIRDLLPLSEHARLSLADDDRSLQFHIAHSVQREVEVLHDELLLMLAEAPSDADAGVLRPRDIVVMVPDIAQFSAAIQAVFDQYGRQDARYIPYEIADTTERQINPLYIALEWLMRLPQQRCLQSEIRDLLDVPAIAARFGLEEADLPRLGSWIEGAGVRWGLDASHRASLGLGQVGEQNSWMFGVRRMLLGYANGDAVDFDAIQPYPEIAGLDAALAGSLADMLDKLMVWRTVLSEAATPAVWAQRARSLLSTFFAPESERDKLSLAQLEQALQSWLDDCEIAHFEQAVPLAVMREAWLGQVEESNLTQRFVSGGVTFCTLMPMRAVPFRVICLLGMNDGDYPRRAQHADFDLLALPGTQRPGDRSRRDDDRYLMLEALLAARERLYISWVGRNIRDNSEQPPSVLVAQLRDYLAAGWDLDLTSLTSEHPLQPFSRRYFEAGGPLTFAREWRAAHEGEMRDSMATGLTNTDAALAAMEPGYRLNLSEFSRFMRQPVTYFFRQRLQVSFPEQQLVSADEEPFSLNRLDEYQFAQLLLQDDGDRETLDDVQPDMERKIERLAREGVFPVGQMGKWWQQQLLIQLVPVRQQWLRLCARYPQPAAKHALALSFPAVQIEDWLDQCWTDGSRTVWLAMSPANLCQAKGEELQVRPDACLPYWLRQLVSAACGVAVPGYLVGRDAVLYCQPLSQPDALQTLDSVLACWQRACQQPLPVARKTAFALLSGKNPEECYDGSYTTTGENQDPCLHRMWPDFAALSAEPDWKALSQTLYQPVLDWIQQAVQIQPLQSLDGAATEQNINQSVGEAAS
ncbi:exodeoxyribonuclease V subunit gamma [Undibacterium curvum]|uniref:RecBCD enzyme subunit RecC n=1 Tax=Undibacterium curvum TaxID=2762294 RepID=A0ABR7A990_9BURK|nr:exodeoxyribonuclease V subunit gamma [Undibacterium curvum]MBC3933470.1 exodeoxyribonuclease V subunit gamma [Undibacterium curvum]